MADLQERIARGMAWLDEHRTHGEWFRDAEEIRVYFAELGPP